MVQRSRFVCVLVCIGCGGRAPATAPGASAGAGAGASAGAQSQLAPQSTLAKQYPVSKADYWCQWPETTGYSADKYPTRISVEPKQVTVFSRSGDDRTVYPLDAEDGAYVIARSAPEDEQRSIVLADKLLLFKMVEKPGAEREIEFVCGPKAEQARITGAPAATHLARLKAYGQSRFDAFLASGAAADVTDEPPATEATESPPAKPKKQWTPEQAAKLARGRTMASFSIVASQKNRKASTALVVTMKLADGSTLTSGLGDPVFFELFAWSTIPMVPEEKGVFVQVWPRGEDGERVMDLEQTLAVPYTFDTDRAFVCEGGSGKTGLDQNWNNSGMKFYHGQPGETGPAIKVEITTVGSSTPQVLRYRLSCGAKRSVFNASPSSPVHVTSIGGKGGHGIPRANGDGTNGGNGGNGGDITVIADPSVISYTVTHSSIGGKGGNSSDKSQTNDFSERSIRRGAEGAPGQFEEKRAPVSIP